jgi:uncharacterized protein YggE
MAHAGGSQPGFRANRRTIVGGGLGIAGVAGMAAVAGPAGVARAAAGAQPGTPDAVASALPGSIRVIGHGSVPLAPDAATVTVGVDVSAPALSEAQAEASATMEAILEAIAAQGIPDEDVQTATFSVNPIREFDPQTGVPGDVTSFQVTNTVNVKVSDISTLGELLDAVVAAGANNIWGVTFFTSEPGEAATEARSLAIEDAQTKAQELADAAGLTLGRILAISESVASVGPIYDLQQAGGGRAGDVPIAPGTNAVTAAIEVLFELAS